jgi:IclR family acetate operon transcriptional repressor
MTTKRATEDTTSTAVERTLRILEAVAERGPLTNSELSRRLEIPKSSASYILRTLEQRGYLRRESSTGRYRLGLKMLSFTRGALAGLDIREIALPLLRQLVERSHLTAHLAILDHGEAVYIEKVEAPGFIKMDTWVGRRLQVNSTAVGKTLLAWLPQPEVEAIIKQPGQHGQHGQSGLKKLTPKTITTHAAFLRELEKVRAQGYAIDDEENSLGVRCVAAPVFDSLGRVAASVGVSGATTQNDRAHLPKVAELVKATARKISQQLGAG